MSLDNQRNLSAAISLNFRGRTWPYALDVRGLYHAIGTYRDEEPPDIYIDQITLSGAIPIAISVNASIPLSFEYTAEIPREIDLTGGII